MVENRYRYPGGTNGYIQYIMDVYGFNGVTTGVMSYSSIKSHIDADKPIYTEWWASDGVGHALVVMGYYTTASYIYIKDPNFPTTTYAIVHDNNIQYTENKISYGDRIFTYQDNCYSIIW